MFSKTFTIDILKHPAWREMTHLDDPGVVGGGGRLGSGGGPSGGLSEVTLGGRGTSEANGSGANPDGANSSMLSLPVSPRVSERASSGTGDA